MTDRLLGLRVDVDTHDGMRDGVPRLLDLLKGVRIGASFYFAMGPDRSGLAVFNALRPGFLKKMGRTKVARVYGWRTLLSGTLLPSRPVAIAFPGNLLRAKAEGHEAGVHGWDHRSWQDRLDRFPESRVQAEQDQAREAFKVLAGRPPATAAAPAWLTDGRALLHQDTMGLSFASDCRGREPFLPVVGARVLVTPQVPATLPTLDEALGESHPSPEPYFRSLLEMACSQAWPVLTVHAELEGGPYASDFARFLKMAPEAGLSCVPLGEVLRRRISLGALPTCPVGRSPVPGRHGVVSVQGPYLEMK